MTLQEILLIASKILKEYDLCDNCIGRLFSKKLNLQSNKNLGKKIKSHLNLSSKKCFICKNLLVNLKPYIELMLEKSSDYQYSTFVVGAILKPSIIDKDDFIRSKFKLKGIDSVKTDLTHELAKHFKNKTRKKLDPLNPDLTFTINTKNESCDIRSKFLIIKAAYSKLERGLPQKQKYCTNCLGKGCTICNFHGIDNFDSIEGIFSNFLFEKFGGTTVKFTWVGGEDKNSLVFEPGRPFFAKLQNPNKRKTRLPNRFKHKSLIFNNLKILPELPKQPIKFQSVIKIYILTQKEIPSDRLKKLKLIPKSPVIIYENSGKRLEKIIYSLKYQKRSKNNFTLTIAVDGGFPVKRFVNDSNVVPNIEQIIENSCKCNYFDFHNISLNENN